MNKFKIIILGGGTAGWLTALFLNKFYPNILDITVIENPSKPPIIAGESGGNALSLLLKRLDINLQEWITYTNATPKLGGIFLNWSGKNSKFIHGLVHNYTKFFSKRHESDEERHLYLNYLWKNNIPISELLLSTKLIDNNCLAFNDQGQLQYGINPMWHFDSRKNADFLKKISLKKNNIRLIEDEFIYSKKDNKNCLLSLVCKKHEIKGDYFFDCSGFSRLLLGKEFNIKKIDQSKWFPCDSVIPWWENTNLKSYTLATALSSGWSWEINLLDRSGNGYLFSSSVLDYDAAIKEINETLKKQINPITLLKFTPSFYEKSWEKNVIGIGLSTGFIEPLEANGTGIIVDQLYALVENWNPLLRRELKNDFNDTVLNAYTNIRDFLLLHYLGKGIKNDFWLTLSNMQLPLSLEEKISEFKNFYITGKINEDYFRSQYSLESWLTVIQGLNLFKAIEINKPNYDNYFINFYLKEKNLQNRFYKNCIKANEWKNIIQKLV